MLALNAQDTNLEAPMLDALKNQDTNKVSELLELSNTETSPVLEALILKNAKEAVLRNDLDWAAKIAEIVLLHNLDNIEAQDMFTAIEDAKRSKLALEERKRKLAEEAEAKALEEKLKFEAEVKASETSEAIEIAQQEEDIKQAEAAKVEAQRKAQEAAYLKSVREVTIKNFSGLIDVSPASILVGGSAFADAFSASQSINTKYGFMSLLEARFLHPYVGAGLSFSYEIDPIGFGSLDIRNSLSARACVGTPLTILPVYVSFGYRQFSYASNLGGEANSVLFTALGSPTLGFGIEKWQLTKDVEATLRMEWLAVSITDPLIDFSMSVDFNSRYKFMRFANMFTLYAGLSSNLDMIFAANKAEWNASGALLLGVLINENRTK